MATAERVLWETITVIVFLVLLAGTVFWSSARVDRHRSRLEAEFDTKLAAAEQQLRDETERLELDFERRSREYEIREAKAIFRSFEAGVRSAVASRWGNYVSRAKSNLLVGTHVTFVHILTPSGLVLSSSDEKLARTGRIDERGDWALAATELAMRDGSQEGHIELAGPVTQGSRTVAFLWLGYDLSAEADAPAED
ncbi:MAG: hypothetical protein ACE5GX_04750 [Thermoanaerobaculia bacterium]